MSIDWKPAVSFKELDEHMENAFKRAAGLVGHKITIDSFNTNALASTAESFFDAVTSAGPFFLKVGKGALELSGYRPRNAISLKEAAADILNEFYKEGQTAFQASRLRFAAEARAHMEKNSVSEAKINEIIAAADNAFLPIPGGEMKRAAEAYITQGLTPGVTACLCALAGMAVMIFLIRHPFAIAIGGALGGGIAYYQARQRLRRKASTLIEKLPQDLYRIFKGNLSSNYSHFQDVVNAALAAS